MPMTKASICVTDEATVAWCAGSPSTTTTAPSRRSWPNRNAAPPPAYLHPSAGGDPARRPRHPVYQPSTPDVGADCDDVVVVTITAAEQILGVARTTLYR